MDLPILLGELFTIIEGNSISLPYITYCVCDAEAEAMVIQCNLVVSSVDRISLFEKEKALHVVI